MNRLVEVFCVTQRHQKTKKQKTKKNEKQTMVRMAFLREINFARCNDAAGAIILHDSAAGNTSRTGRTTLQQRKVQSQRFLQNYEF